MKKSLVVTAAVASTIIPVPVAQAAEVGVTAVVTNRTNVGVAAPTEFQYVRVCRTTETVIPDGGGDPLPQPVDADKPFPADADVTSNTYNDGASSSTTVYCGDYDPERTSFITVRLGLIKREGITKMSAGDTFSIQVSPGYDVKLVGQLRDKNSQIVGAPAGSPTADGKVTFKLSKEISEDTEVVIGVQAKDGVTYSPSVAGSTCRFAPADAESTVPFSVTCETYPAVSTPLLASQPVNTDVAVASADPNATTWNISDIPRGSSVVVSPLTGGRAPAVGTTYRKLVGPDWVTLRSDGSLVVAPPWTQKPGTNLITMEITLPTGRITTTDWYLTVNDKIAPTMTAVLEPGKEFDIPIMEGGANPTIVSSTLPSWMVISGDRSERLTGVVPEDVREVPSGIVKVRVEDNNSTRVYDVVPKLSLENVPPAPPTPWYKTIYAYVGFGVAAVATLAAIITKVVGLW